MSKLAGALARTPRWLLIVGALALAFYAVNAIHYGKLPLRIEECEWPPMAKAVFDSGKPVIEAADAQRIRFAPDVSVDQSPVIGAWHPPLYIYSLGASMAVLGTDATHALRGFGALCLLVAIGLLLLIAREITPRWRLVGGIASALLLVHPYAIQGSLFLDIDTSIYAPLALLVVYLAIRFGRSGEPLSYRQVLALGASIALVTWAKVPTTIVLVAALVVWWVLSRRPFWRGALEAAGFTLVGAALFFSTYALWCEATDIPFSYTFQVTFAEKSNRLFSDWLFVDHALHWHLRWWSVALIILAAVYLLDLLRNLIRERRLRPMDLVFLAGGGILLQYTAISPTDGTYQGKYTYTALSMVLLSVVWMLLRDQPEQLRLRLRPALLWAAAAGLGVVAALLLNDNLTGLSYFGDYGSWGDELRTALIVGAAFALAWALGGRKGFPAGVLIVLAAVLGAQAVHSYRANTSPLYPVPDTSEFQTIVNDINAIVPDGDVVVGPKDIDFLVDGRIIEGDDAFFRGDDLLAKAIVRYPKISAFARDSFGPPVGPKTEAVLQRCFTEVHALPTASVAYRSKPCRAVAGK